MVLDRKDVGRREQTREDDGCVGVEAARIAVRRGRKQQNGSVVGIVSGTTDPSDNRRGVDCKRLGVNRDSTDAVVGQDLNVLSTAGGRRSICVRDVVGHGLNRCLSRRGVEYDHKWRSEASGERGDRCTAVSDRASGVSNLPRACPLVENHQVVVASAGGKAVRQNRVDVERCGIGVSRRW